jgi:predicted GNAT family acetyltransferase
MGQPDEATPGPTGCAHLAGIADVSPSSPDGCTACLAAGDTWVNLRICLTCGQVSCCDASPNRHATAHHRATGHPIIQSFQPGEAWRWCYVDDRMLPDGVPFRPAGPKAPPDLPIVRIDKGEVGGFFVRNPEPGDPEYLAEVTYYWRDRLMVITHTTVREQLAGQGTSKRLYEAAVEAARAEGFKILPQCPVALRTFNKRADWNDVRHRY